jgi:hypothetical protein
MRVAADIQKLTLLPFGAIPGTVHSIAGGDTGETRGRRNVSGQFGPKARAPCRTSVLFFGGHPPCAGLSRPLALFPSSGRTPVLPSDCPSACCGESLRFRLPPAFAHNLPRMTRSSPAARDSNRSGHRRPRCRSEMGANPELLGGQMEANGPIDAIPIHKGHGRHPEFRADRSVLLGNRSSFVSTPGQTECFPSVRSERKSFLPHIGLFLWRASTLGWAEPSF